MYIDICHMNAAISIDDLNIRILVFLLDTLIHLDYEWNKLRNILLEVCERTCLKRFCKDRVVRICTCLAYFIKRFIYRKRFFFYKYPDKFWNYHCRMSIIDLNNSMLMHLAQIDLLILELTKYKLCRIAYHEIFLIDTQEI